MRLHRITTRRRFAVIAVATLVLGLWVRQQRLLAIALRHNLPATSCVGCPPEEQRRIMRQNAYNREMVRKYRLAARYPWLPVPPDPPPPE